MSSSHCTVSSRSRRQLFLFLRPREGNTQRGKEEREGPPVFSPLARPRDFFLGPKKYWRLVRRLLYCMHENKRWLYKMQVFYGSGFPTERKLKVIERIIIYVKDEQSLLAILHLSRGNGDLWGATDPATLSLHLILVSDSLRASQKFTLSNKRYYSPKPLLYNLANADMIYLLRNDNAQLNLN